MTTIVDYNGHHVRLGSPLDKRLRKQDANYRDCVQDGDGNDLETPAIPLIDDGENTSGPKSDAPKGPYDDLKKPELDAELDKRQIEVPADARSNAAKNALLVADDEAKAAGDPPAAEGQTLA